MANQTTANESKLVLGSGKIEIGTSISTLEDVGAGYGIKLTEGGSTSELKFDNASTISKTVKDSMTLEMELAEFDLEKIKTIFAGPGDVYDDTTTPGTRKLTVKSANFIPPAFVVRVTHQTDTVGEYVRVTMNKAQSQEFLQINFAADGGTEVAKFPVKFKGVADTNGIIYEIEDTRTY